MGMYGAYGAPLGGLVSINGEAAFSESSMASLSLGADGAYLLACTVAVVYTQVQTTDYRPSHRMFSTHSLFMDRGC